MTLRVMTTLLAGAALLLVTSTAFADGIENTAVEEAESTAERQARGEIESLIGRLCPGRCELVDLDVTADEPRAVGDVRPGFEGSGGPSDYEVEIRRIEATVMMDADLPENFQANLPRMAQFRLQELADDVEVRPEMLDFPSPQIPPTPEGFERTPEPPPPMPEPLPAPEPEPAEQPEDDEDEDADEEDEAVAEAPFWQQALPWIALLLTLLILGGLIILILRRLEALTTAADRSDAPESADSDSSRTEPMPDTEQLQSELTRSRSALNEMLRQWIRDNPEEVALLVRLVGPDILSDLRRDPEMRSELRVVSDHVASIDERIDAATANAIVRKARSRHEAQQVISDSGADAEWEFLEGLTLGQIAKLLDATSRRETGFVLTRLPAAVRSRYLEQLNPDRRRELMLEASSGEGLSRTESRRLAGRLRRVAEEFPDHAREAEGRATMLIEMLESMGADERRDVISDLLDDRPGIARAVLANICLERALMHVPDDAIADTVQRMPVEALTTFLQGTDDIVSQRVLDAAPPAKRQAVTTELSLEIPVNRADFLEARREFSDAIVTNLRRGGYDVIQFNTAALDANSPRSTEPEVAQ